MDQRVLNVGLIGLGEVAQIIHLPVLELYPDRFRVRALCDISKKTLEAIGQKYNVDNLYEDASELVKQPDLDVVFVLNSDEYHAECAVAAANAGKHVLIEKPMCLTESEADAIIEAKNRNQVRVMVGYMRRYAAPFVQAVQAIKETGAIQYARVRDIIGPNSSFIEPVSRVLRFGDIPEPLAADRRRRAEALMREALGEGADAETVRLYRMLCGLSCHDLSAMREALGMPRGVIGANISRNGAFFLNVIFDYDGFTVTFETGIDKQGRFDCHLEVYGSDTSIKVEYDTPYIRHLPVKLHIAKTDGERYDRIESRPTFKDPYRFQLEHLYNCIVRDIEPKTSPEDFKEDLTVFRMIVDAVRRSGQLSAVREDER